MTNILAEFTCIHCSAPKDEVQRVDSGRWNSQFFNILLFIFGTLFWDSLIIALRNPRLHCLCKWFCLWLTAHSNGESGRIITTCLQHSCYLGKSLMMMPTSITGALLERCKFVKTPRARLAKHFLSFICVQIPNRHVKLIKVEHSWAFRSPFWLMSAAFTPHLYHCWIRGL